MEHKEVYDAQKLKLIINCFADPTELGSSSNYLFPSPHQKKKTNEHHQMHVHTPTTPSKVGFINKWELGNGEVYSRCSILKGEHCQALWHALHSSARCPQSLTCPIRFSHFVV